MFYKLKGTEYIYELTNNSFKLLEGKHAFGMLPINSNFELIRVNEFKGVKGTEANGYVSGMCQEIFGNEYESALDLFNDVIRCVERNITFHHIIDTFVKNETYTIGEANAISFYLINSDNKVMSEHTIVFIKTTDNVFFMLDFIPQNIKESYYL